jgi:hypothetical protein
MQRLTVFISSTVKDFGPIRSDLRAWLRQNQADVRISEAADFPVDDAVTSHDACLHALEGCHLALVLIGRRYGGAYAGTHKSITQREYEQAQRLGIPTIVLVPRDVTADAEKWSKGQLKNPPFEADTARVVAFLDRVRKGHTNNWFHADWDGTLREACRIVQSRLNALFVRYREPHQSLVEKAKRLPDYAAARLMLDQAVQVLAGTRSPPTSKLLSLLDVVAEKRNALLSYQAGDRWNFAIYAPAPGGRSLRVIARKADPTIAVTNRPWKVGQGHVGTCWQLGQRLVAADLLVTSSWVAARPEDEENYRSAVAEPIRNRRGEKKAVLVATSSRIDHFRDLEQPEIATLASLGLYVSLLIS